MEDIEQIKAELQFFKNKYSAAVMSLIQYQHGAGTDPSYWHQMKADLHLEIKQLKEENDRLKSRIQAP